jgi:hypothetical protein
MNSLYCENSYITVYLKASCSTELDEVRLNPNDFNVYASTSSA